MTYRASYSPVREPIQFFTCTACGDTAAEGCCSCWWDYSRRDKRSKPCCYLCGMYDWPATHECSRRR